MILWLVLAFVVGFVVGTVFAIRQTYYMRRRWEWKAKVRAQIAKLAEDEGDGDVIVIHQCGPVCQECRDEGWPEWICMWLI